MTQFFHQYRAWLAPLLTLIIATLLLSALLIPLSAKQRKYDDIIKSSQPRIERMLGLINAAPHIEAQLAIAQASAKQRLYPEGSDDNRLNTELQARLRSLAQQNSLTVGSISAPPARKERGLSVFLLRLNLQGGIAELQKFLDALERPTDAAPILKVDNIFLRRANFLPNTPQTLNIDITIAALRPLQP